MTVHILGSLNYHNETITVPILDELNRRHVKWVWSRPQSHLEDGANVHVEEFTSTTLNYWKDMLRVLPDLKNGDSVFILDMWNPIVFDLKFYSTRNNLNLKFYTIHHGSSHLPGDFAAQPEFSWTHAFEDAWIGIYDKIFFGSNNAMQQVVNKTGFKEGKYVVSYLPIDCVKNSVRPNVVRYDKTVIMPLRLDLDKGASEFFDVVKNNPDYTFHCSKFHANVDIPNLPNLIQHESMSRVKLFELMASCEYVLSCAKQETFGYGVLEAVFMGCKPLLQKSSENCYNELYKEFCLFDDASKLNLDLVSYDEYDVLRDRFLDAPAQETIVKEIMF